MQNSLDPEYQRMNKERSQAAAARNRTLQVAGFHRHRLSICGTVWMPCNTIPTLKDG